MNIQQKTITYNKDIIKKIRRKTCHCDGLMVFLMCNNNCKELVAIFFHHVEKQAQHGPDQLNKPRAGSDEDRSARPGSDQGATSVDS